MRTLFARCLLVSIPALVQLPDAAGVHAQTQLPEIRVTAPSPIVRRAPLRSASPAPAPADEAPSPPAPEIPQAGVLPIVTDQFATVTYHTGADAL